MIIQNPKQPDEEIDDEMFEKEFQRILKESLTERELAVIYLRFWEKLTLKESGKRINLSQERVRQIESKALRKLRHPTRVKELMKLGGLVHLVRKWWDGEKKEEKQESEELQTEYPTLEKLPHVTEIDPDGPIPDFVVIERWDSESPPYLAIRVGELGKFPPLTMDQYNKWLKEALEREQDALGYTKQAASASEA